MTTQTIRKILTRDFILGFFAQFTFLSVFYILIPTLPIYLLRSGSKEAEIGVLIGIFFISSLVLRPFVGKALLKIPEKNFMIAGALLFVLTSFAYLLAPPFLPFLIVRVFQGIGLAFFHTASFTLIANISPEAHRGQSLSYFLLGPNVCLALAPSLGMFLINHFSFTLLFLVCLGISLCSLFITNKLGRRQIALQEGSSNENGFFLSWKALPPSIISFFNFMAHRGSEWVKTS
jgi:MFS family permease